MKKFIQALSIVFVFTLFVGQSLFAYTPIFGVQEDNVTIGGTPVPVSQSGLINNGDVVGNIRQNNINLSLKVYRNDNFSQDNLSIGIVILDNTTYTSDYNGLINDNYSPDNNSDWSNQSYRYLEAIVYPIEVATNSSDETSVTIPDTAKIYFRAYTYDHSIAFKGNISNNTQNGPVTSDSSGNLTFDPNNLIQKVRDELQNRDVETAEAAEDLIPSGIYKFKIITDIPIGYYDNGSLTEFDNTTPSNWDINGVTDSPVIAAGAPVLSGTIEVVDNTSVTLPSESTSGSSTSSGTSGGETTTSQDEEAAAEEEIDNAGQEAVSDVEDALESGDSEAIVDSIDSLGDTIGSAIDDLQDDVDGVANILDTSADAITDVLDTIASSENADDEIIRNAVTQAETEVSNIIDKVTDAISEPENVTIEHAEKIVTNTSDMVSSILKTSKDLNIGLGEDVIEKAQELTQNILEATLDDLAKETGKTIEPVTTPEELQKTLEDNPDLMDDVIDTAAIDVTDAVTVEKAEVQNILKQAGLSEETAQEVADALPTVANPDAAVLAKEEKVITTTNVVEDAVKNISTDVKIESTDYGSVEVEVSGFKVATFIKEVKIVPSSIPEGVHALPNGRAVSVKNGIAVVLTPAPKDPVGVITGIQDSKIDDDGLISINTDSGKLIGTFGWEVKGGSSVAAHTTSFEMVGGDPASEAYGVLARYSDGSTQMISPYVASLDNFSNDMDKFFGANYSMDRDTGVLTVTTNNKEYKFKFTYIVTPIESGSDDEDWYNANKDSNGVAYKDVGDLNGDGLTDFKVYSSEGMQVIYWIK